MLEKEFYEYWDTLKPYIFIPPDDYQKTKNQTRRNIIEILSVGIDEFVEGTSKIRRVLNAFEIQEQLKLQYDQEIGKSNMYFHLGILEEIKMIKTIKRQINEGRGQKYMSYYGRSAKLYLESEPYERNFSELEILNSKSENYTGLVEFLKNVNPNLDQSAIEHSFELMRRMNNKNNVFFQKFYEEFEEKLIKYKVSLRSLYTLLYFIRVIDSDVYKGIQQFRDLLNYR